MITYILKLYLLILFVSLREEQSEDDGQTNGLNDRKKERKRTMRAERKQGGTTMINLLPFALLKAEGSQI